LAAVGEKKIDKSDFIVRLTKQFRWADSPPAEKELIMFSVTEKATEMIKEFLKDRTEIPSIRVVMQEGG
jgi:hypothetical protein